jgi:hypothetical protein
METMEVRKQWSSTFQVLENLLTHNSIFSEYIFQIHKDERINGKQACRTSKVRRNLLGIRK